ncbi:XK-related protein 8.3 [Diretmus argenteus]
MDRPRLSKYSWLDFVFSVVGVCTFVLDWGSDVWVATEFYLRGDFFWFGVLVSLMVQSSVVVQMFSWFWFKYDRDLEGFTAMFGDRVKLSFLLHVLQLGFFCRHVSAIWRGFRVWWRQEQGSEYAVYLTHDLSMLRLIETFCESAPQLTLMTYILLQTNRARTVQSWMVLDYHRSLRSFLPDKAKQDWSSSVVYFLWNLLLIAPRVAAIALFASVLPNYIIVHFLILWLILVFWVWRQKTNFMDSAGGEWLYRATVGLIWYFSWFNVADGQTRVRSVIYHTFMTTDGGILLTTWWCYRDPVQTQAYGLILLTTLPLIYLLGLSFKALYYCCFHPKLWRPPSRDPGLPDEMPDGTVPFRDFSIQDDTMSSQLLNKRMARHATHFYLEQDAVKNISKTKGENEATSDV